MPTIVLKFNVGGTTACNEMFHAIEYVMMLPSYDLPGCNVYIIWEVAGYGENPLLDTMISYTTSLARKHQHEPFHVMLQTTESPPYDLSQWNGVLTSEVSVQYIRPPEQKEMIQAILRNARIDTYTNGRVRNEQMRGFLSAYSLNQFVHQQQMDPQHVHVFVFDNRAIDPLSFETEGVFLHHDFNHHVYIDETTPPESCQLEQQYRSFAADPSPYQHHV
jgi:hypothetical protein